MKKFLTTLVMLLICTVCVCAQNSNKYVVKLKNGIDIECVSYKLTADNNIEITYTDESTVSIKMDDVDKIAPLGAPQEEPGQINMQASQSTEPQIRNTAQPAQQQVYQSTQRQNSQQVVYGNQVQVVNTKPEKSPALAGILSFVIPGVGQFYNGQIGAGLGFMLGSVLSMSLASSFAALGDPGMFLVFFGTSLAIDIWAIIHAVQGAKRINFERGFALGNGQFLDIQPAIMSAPVFANNNKYDNTYGLSFGLRF